MSPRPSTPALLAMLAPALASATEVMPDPRPLAEVLAAARHVLVAKPAVPPVRCVEVAMTPRGEAPDPQRWPPYSRCLTRWVVVEALAGKPGTAGETIEVDAANWKRDRQLHFDHYVREHRKSPIVRSYEPTRITRADPQRVLFLTGDTQRGFSFVVAGAMDGVGLVPSLREPLRRRPEPAVSWVVSEPDALAPWYEAEKAEMAKPPW
jgi:hypothetical protein